VEFAMRANRMMLMNARTISMATLTLLCSTSAIAKVASSPEARAAATEAAMTDDERVSLTNGVLPLPAFPGMKIPDEAVVGSDYVPGVP